MTIIELEYKLQDAYIGKTTDSSKYGILLFFVGFFFPLLVVKQGDVMSTPVPRPNAARFQRKLFTSSYQIHVKQQIHSLLRKVSFPTAITGIEMFQEWGQSVENVNGVHSSITCEFPHQQNHTVKFECFFVFVCMFCFSCTVHHQSLAVVRLKDTGSGFVQLLWFRMLTLSANHICVKKKIKLCKCPLQMNTQSNKTRKEFVIFHLQFKNLGVKGQSWGFINLSAAPMTFCMMW